MAFTGILPNLRLNKVRRHNIRYSRHDYRISVLSKRLYISSNVFTIWQGHHSSFFWNTTIVTKFQGHIIKYGEKLRLSTDIGLYLGNGTKQVHGYYGSLIESHVYRN